MSGLNRLGLIITVAGLDTTCTGSGRVELGHSVLGLGSGQVRLDFVDPI